MKHAAWIVIFVLVSWIGPEPRAAEDSRPQEMIQKTVRALGGSKFLSAKDMFGYGRMFVIKRDGQAWTKFWEYYRWDGKSRTELEKPREALVDIYNLELGKGWSYEYGKVKPKTDDEMRRFRQSEKRNVHNLFRGRWKEDGMKIIYYSPAEIETVKPMEALEFIDAENYTVTVFFDEGNSLPVRVEYQDRNPDGIVLPKAEMLFRWFETNGVMAPHRVEFFTRDTNTGLVEYTEVQFNVGLSEDLFLEPLPVTKKK
jgi:hypothetical protein